MIHCLTQKPSNVKDNILRLSMALLLSFALEGLYAQHGVQTAGGDATGTEGSTSYSIGQVVYVTHFSDMGSMAHGLQIPYEITVATALEEANHVRLTFSAYPNPVSDNLLLEADRQVSGPLYYHLYSLDGALLKSRRIVAERTKLSMSGLPPATYILKVRDPEKILKTFKIIKK